MKGKKAFLFTLVTIFLLFSAFLLSYSYMVRNRESQSFLAELSHTNKLNFIKENIVSDYFSLLDIELDEISRTDSYIYIRFDNFSYFNDTSDYPSYLLDFEDFLENNFSNMSNARITLENFDPEFSFYPFNSTFLIDNLENPNEFFFYVRDYERLNEIKMDISVNISQDTLNSTSWPSNDSSADPLVRVRVLDSSKNVIADKIRLLNSTEENENFVVMFNKTATDFQNLTFSYGMYRKLNPFGDDILTNATFHMLASDLKAHITNLSVNYSLSSKNAVLMTKANVFLD